MAATSTARSLYRYRTYCYGCSNNVYQWSLTPPTTCVIDSVHHAIDSNSTVIVDQITQSANEILNLPKTSFDEIRVAERTRIIELKSIFGKSDLRDVYNTSNTGVVTNNIGDSEYTLSITSSNDYAELRSAERGRYVAGLQGEVGVACRLPASLSGNQFIKIGLFDESNGLYFKYTSVGMYACILRDGVETATHQSNWNNDPMNGTGPSKLNLDFTRGIIFLIQFTWYGFGNIQFKFNTSANTNIQNSWLAHTYTPMGMTSVKNPNLPISVALGAGGTASPASVYVAGRQYSLLGKYEPITRINAGYRFGRAIGSTTTFLPVISIQRKQGFLGTPVRAVQCDFLATSDQLVQIRINTVLTGAAFTTPSETNANDTSIQIDTTATAVTGGIPIWMGVITGDNRSVVSSLNIAHNLTEYQILTVCSRALTATNGNLGVVIRWTEEW